MKTFKLFTIASLFALFFTVSANAEDPIYTGFFSSEAISGYDTVSYFTGGEPVKGKDEFKTKWRGATWKFSSAENLAAFEASPEKYAPQYGGYCAWAIADGNFAEGNPKIWAIENGKLYLNYNDTVRGRWDEDRADFITRGDEQYPALVDLN